ncbi:hypothetical protein SAMN05216559_1947 [Halomicrobium zhouii]|uniref:Uncharacterized protein n=1 Tax=Halomicrobium zhouii TaxID=767519 RepID=A0A1I6L3F5_9EURY|nr:hypothetical protein SAMN05216559_1947 [Halomicrobium zhouii]
MNELSIWENRPDVTEYERKHFESPRRARGRSAGYPHCVRVGPAERLPVGATPPRPFSPPGPHSSRGLTSFGSRSRLEPPSEQALTSLGSLRSPRHQPSPDSARTRRITLPTTTARRSAGSAGPSNARDARPGERQGCGGVPGGLKGRGGLDEARAHKHRSEVRSAVVLARVQRAEGFLGVGGFLSSSTRPTEPPTQLTAHVDQVVQTNVYPEKRSSAVTRQVAQKRKVRRDRVVPSRLVALNWSPLTLRPSKTERQVKTHRQWI